MLITTPIRPTPTSFPPIGSLSIISYLRKNGIEIDFYHIDALRPEYDDALRHIVEAKPDILGISSVVSTAYDYTKRLALDIKAALPETLIIVGGSLAASAEILLRRAGVDLCALGEGEKVMLNVIRRAQTTIKVADFKDIPGLALIDENNNFVNTGYEGQLDCEEIYDVSWSDLENACDISTYFYPALNEGKPEFWFEKDPRSYEPHREDKNVASLPAAKGCVSKCTFCHRWEKGIRYIPPKILRARIQELVDRYNVGFLNIVDENFGTDKKWLREFCSTIKEFDILWRVAGMRVNCIDPDRIEMMKDAGCVAILYGMETGSDKILKIMEKKVKLQDNYNAMKWTTDAKQATVVQLVIGMPGENPSTIHETADFAAYASTLDKNNRPWDLSINFAQALPGTPLYEYARRVGLIDSTMDGEEAYLLKISDKSASDEESTINFTSYPYFIHRSWRQLIQLRAAAAYISKYGKGNYSRMLLNDTRYFKRATSEETGYFNKPKKEIERTLVSDSVHDERLAENIGDRGLPSFWALTRRLRFGLLLLCYPVFFSRFSWSLPLVWFLISIRRHGVAASLRELYAWLSGKLERKTGNPEGSLRKIIRDDMPAMPSDTPEMDPLRLGR